MSATEHPIRLHPHAGAFTSTGAVSRRASSWDRTGANVDFRVLQAGETAVLLDVQGPGMIGKIYMAVGINPLEYFRDSILRCYWDGETEPSVEVPLGDFFCISHCRVRTFSSHFVSVNPGMGWSFGLNCYFPMPFAERARVTIENRADHIAGFLEHIEYELYDQPLPRDVLRFHAQWRREWPTQGVGPHLDVTMHQTPNIGGEENYVALEARGAGQMVGLHLQVHNQGGGWYGEGDDMVFLDGDTWPPSIHGTGTEEVFGGGACPNVEYAGIHSGFHLIESPDYSGHTGMYRWYTGDPIRFRESIRWTIEHGHANNYSNDYTSVAYWYQDEPHQTFAVLPGKEAMRPRFGPRYEEAKKRARSLHREAFKGWAAGMKVSTVALHELGRQRLIELYFQGRFAEFLDAVAASDAVVDGGPGT
ncbi:MAG: glycoside hydrolase family 172 protein [Candidatus Dormibacteria bacterium]